MILTIGTFLLGKKKDEKNYFIDFGLIVLSDFRF